MSINRINAKPTVTSGLDPRDLGFNMTPSNPTAAGLPFITVTGFFTHAATRSSRSRPASTTCSASPTI